MDYSVLGGAVGLQAVLSLAPLRWGRSLLAGADGAAAAPPEGDNAPPDMVTEAGGADSVAAQALRCERRGAVEDPTREALCLELSPNGALVAVADSLGRVLVYDATSLAVVRLLHSLPSPSLAHAAL